MDAHIFITVGEDCNRETIQPVHLLIAVCAPGKEQEIAFPVTEKFGHFFHVGNNRGSKGDPVDRSGEGIVQVFRISVHFKTCI